MNTMFDEQLAGERLADPAIDDEFLSMICADEEWLRAEFDAIVDGLFVDRPRRRRPQHPASRPPIRHNSPRTHGLPLQDPPIRRQARVRSPPREPSAGERS